MERSGRSTFIETTMLELVSTLAEELEDEREVVQIVQQMIAAGRVRLIGTFRGDFRELQIEDPNSKTPPEAWMDQWPRECRAKRTRLARASQPGQGDRP